MSTEALGENIRKLLEEKGISCSDFSEMVDVAPATVYRWISGGAGKMMVSKLFQVAEVLGTTVDALSREEPRCTDDAKSAGKS